MLVVIEIVMIVSLCITTALACYHLWAHASEIGWVLGTVMVLACAFSIVTIVALAKTAPVFQAKATECLDNKGTI